MTTLIVFFSLSAFGDLKMSFNKPYFYLKIDISQCRYSVEVNDVPVLEDFQGLPINTQIPINQWLKDSENQLSVKLFSVKDANEIANQANGECKSDVQLIVKNDDGEASPVNITDIKYSSPANQIDPLKSNISEGGTPAKHYVFSNSENSITQKNSGNIVISEPSIQSTESFNHHGVEISRSVTMPLTYPKWKWLSSDTIPNNEETKTSLLKEYQKIWADLKDKKVKELDQLFQERNVELAKAYYKTPSYFQSQLNLQEMVNDPKMELVGIYPEYTHLKVFGDGKLATIVSWDWETPVLVYNAKDNSFHTTIPVIFRHQNGKWIITR